jgi:TolA-binding protein
MSSDLKNSSGPLAEIAQGPNKFEEFLEHNQLNLIVLAILLAIGAAGLVVYRGIQTSAEETAGAELSHAENISELQAVIKDNGNTQAAGSALVLLADKQWTAGQHDVAIATLEKFISSSPKHPAIPSAKASLGAKLMTQGKFAQASKIFQELVDSSNSKYIAPYALVSLGDIARAGGDFVKAEVDYNLVKSKYPSSSFARTANLRLAIFKAKSPTEIAPLPTAPVPEKASGPGMTLTPAERKARAPEPAH